MLTSFYVSLRLESNSPEVANQAQRPDSILPSCTPMANAALAGDERLREVRFRLVPSRLSEEQFWRCYFWHVTLLKCELLHDWRTANSTRRDAVLDQSNLTAEALSSADSPSGSRRQETIRDYSRQKKYYDGTFKLLQDIGLKII